MAEPEQEQLANLRQQLANLEGLVSVLDEEAVRFGREKLQAEIRRIETGGGDIVLHDQNKTVVHGNVQGGSVVSSGDYAIINVGGNPAAADPAALRAAYLTLVFETVGRLQLSGIDPKAAGEQDGSLNLGAVYTALWTTSINLDKTPIDDLGLSSNTYKALKQAKVDSIGDLLRIIGEVDNDSDKRFGEKFLDKLRIDMKNRGFLPDDITGHSRPRLFSALEQLDLNRRLVLLGDPGSGKSTFVNFIALCLAGEALGRPEANLALLTAPLPSDEERESAGKNKEEPKAQPWQQGALLPVRIVLRDFAARGLPPSGKAYGAKHLLKFLANELDTHHLKAFVPLLEKHLRETGGLLLFDGLDEVPEADRRRVQIKQVVESAARTFPKARILVTSRTYAYQKQDWRLEGFESVELAPFSRGQIAQFIERWYAQMAQARKSDPRDAQGRAALLKERIFGSDRLLALAERPLLLTLMASLHAWRGGSLPEKREQLYADTVELLLDWWQTPKAVRDAQGRVIAQDASLDEWLKVDRERVRKLLDELAFTAHAAQADLVGTADIPEEKLVTGLLHVANNLDARPGQIIAFLRDRAGLLLPRGEGIYTFPHRTFQEYLAACWLSDDGYPEKLTELACADPERWREVTLLAGAKAARGSAHSLWALVDALCFADCPNKPELSRLWGAQLAGQLIVESADLAQVSECNRIKLERVRGWLMRILEGDVLPPRERALAGVNLGRLRDPRKEVTTGAGMGFCRVAAGAFWMGSKEGEEDSDGSERPRHEVTLAEYWLGQYPVTVSQYAEFVQAGGYRDERWWAEARAHGYWTPAGFKGRYDEEPRHMPAWYGMPFDLGNHPVVGVSWYEGLAYTRWLTEQAREAGWIGQDWQIDLPSEAEWEKAARGGLRVPRPPMVCALERLSVVDLTGYELINNPQPDRRYPWGAEFKPKRANTIESGIGSSSAVGCFTEGTSPYGCQELSGNVWEWTRSKKEAYPYISDDGREDETQDTGRVVRGGSWGYLEESARCAVRDWDLPDDLFDEGIGFRMVVRPSSPLNSDSLAL